MVTDEKRAVGNNHAVQCLRGVTRAIVGNDPIKEGVAPRITSPTCRKIRPRLEPRLVQGLCLGTGTAAACHVPIGSFQQRVGISLFVVGDSRPSDQQDKTRRKSLCDELLSAHGDSSSVCAGMPSNRGGDHSVL